MPALSRRERIARLRREWISDDRWVDALLVIESHTGEELFRVGGGWDRQLRRYVDRPCVEHRVRLQESQLELGRSFARWLELARRGEKRPRALIGGGNRGSGKTWFLAGVGFVVMGLAFPGEWQFGVNITAKQKRECLEAIREVALPSWIASDIEDFRDPRTQFITGSTIAWKSAQAPRAIREAGLRLRYILINEGQDQPESVAINSIAAIRNTGGLVGVATNAPQADRSDWVANWWNDIEAGTLNGEKYFVDNKLNRAIDQDSLEDIAAFLRSVNQEAYEADALGLFKLSGPTAYPGFKALPTDRGGHIGVPPALVTGIDGSQVAGWKDVTAELTAEAINSGFGFSWVIGVDFQKHPGVAGQLGKLYRNERGELVLHVLRTIAVKGVEADFSQALNAAGYTTAPGPMGVLLVGDATGARQNAEHRWEQPTSFRALKNDGWHIVPPMKHWKHGTPWNPLVPDSRSQMHFLFDRHQILLHPDCGEPAEGFPSLIESFRRGKIGPRGGLIQKGGFAHCPDGVRYLAWRFLPRAKPIVEPNGGLDMESFNALRGVKIGWGK